jgi:peptidase A4-like protein
MIPRWSSLLATPALILGSMMAAAGSANAATNSHPGITHIRPGGALHGFVPGGLMQRPTGAQARQHGIRNQDESSNWSGYAATGGTFNSVSSSWTQPGATCNDGGDEYAAFWVGLDGFNSDSVEQTGTDSDCSGGSPDYYGWYEMYPAAPVYYNDPVSPGDSMSASVSVSGDTYTLVLTDNTQGWNETQTISESGLSDSSAEVITEAPSDEFGPLPLADFGAINYGGSTANGSSMSAYSPTQIIMVGSSGDQLDSTSGMDGSGDFSNTWLAQS